jgi:hypothetical protein
MEFTPVLADADLLRDPETAETRFGMANTRRFVMAVAIGLRHDYDGGAFRAARLGKARLQVIRDCVLRFNAHGPEGFVNRTAPG